MHMLVDPWNVVIPPLDGGAFQPRHTIRLRGCVSTIRLERQHEKQKKSKSIEPYQVISNGAGGARGRGIPEEESVHRSMVHGRR